MTVDEVVRGVNIALGSLPVGECPLFDGDDNGAVTIDEVVAAVNNALLGCPQEAPTPTPTSDQHRPCGATVLDGNAAFPLSGSTAGRPDSANEATCGFGGGFQSPDQVYEYVAPAAGVYDITVQADFSPLVSARRESCLATQAELGCADAAGGTNAKLTLNLAVGQRIAVIVDGANKVGGEFQLAIHQRRPDLVVTTVSVDAPTANAGEQVRVAATVENRGDGDAGAFTVDFFLARDAAATQVVSLAPLRCSVSGLGGHQTTTCTPPNELNLPLVTEAPYFLVGKADGKAEIAETDETNNALGKPFMMGPPPGTILEQHVFRAGDGTVYQLVQAVPVLQPTDEHSFRITTLAASLGAVTTCEQNGVNAGDPLGAAAGSTQLLELSKVVRTSILKPNNFGVPLFEDRDGGRLEIGAAEGAIEICRRPSRCHGDGLVPVTEATDRTPAACVATPASGSYCEGQDARSTIGFGLAGVGGACTDPAGTIATSAKCNGAATLNNGLTLQPGEAVVFVHEAGREPFEIGLGAFGVTLAATSGCGAQQVVSATAEKQALPRARFLSFVEAQRGSRPLAIAVSPDGRHAYVAGDYSISVLRRDEITGRLQLVQRLQNGVDGLAGLLREVSVSVSPDGAQVYVTSGEGQALLIFQRNASTGALSFLEAKRNGVGGVDGLDGASSVTLSPEGRNVYVASLSAAVVVFRRDAASGALSFVGAERNGVGDVEGLAGAISVTVSPKGDHVYVASLYESAVVVFRRDATSGALSFVEAERNGVRGVHKLDGAYSVTVSPDGGHVYVASFFGKAVLVFRRDPTSGRLSFVESRGDGLDYANSVTMSSDGNHVYVGSVNTGVAVFRRDTTSGALSFVEVERNGFGGRDGFDGVLSVTVSPDGAYVYAADDEHFTVVVYRRDATSGELRWEAAERDGVGGVDGLDGAGAVSVSPDGDHVYVASQSFSAAVTVFRRDETSGALSLVQVERNGVGGVEGLNYIRSLSVSPDGDHVYVASSDTRVAGYREITVVVFRRDVTTGALSFVGTERYSEPVDGLVGAPSVTVSPDGRHVYVATATSPGTVVVFRRDPTSGLLSFVERAGSESDNGVQRIGSSPTDSPDGRNARSVTVSPDGRNVYGPGPEDKPVAVFRRDQTSGALSVVEVERDGLAYADSASVSPDGGHVYVAGGNDDAVAVFRRDTTSGELSFLEAKRDGVEGVDGLDGAMSVTVSPNGGHVLVASFWDDAVAVFRRDAASGALSFVEVERDREGGVDGLDGATSVTMSPDGRHAYVTGSLVDALVVFRVNE